MKNILLYTDTPQIGGAELQMFLLAKFLNKQAFKPILACSNYKQLDKWCENFKKENIKVVRMRVKHKHDPRHYFQLKKIIKENKINLIHAHVWNPASCRYAFSAAKSAKIPIITTEHDPFKLSLLKDVIKKENLKIVSKIITVSENNAKVLRELYPDQKAKIQVIHNGIDIDWWHSQLLRFTDQDRHEIKEHLFMAKENALIITTIGELHERKGQKYLIEAMPEVIKDFPNIKLVIIGDGEERQNLEKLIEKLGLKENVIILGKRKGIPHLLKCSNIFVLPSVREAFGFVLTEAMITPLPVVATKVGGIPEVVVDKKTGILVKSENPEVISKALISLIKDLQKREWLAINGHKRVCEKFDAKIMAVAYEKVYSS